MRAVTIQSYISYIALGFVDLTAVMRQEHDLYGNVWFDLEYLGENGGYHTFKCYRA